jgi:hypothetical protein
MRGHREGFFMLQSRRGFLIGAGSLLTTAFVSDARSFIRRTSQPLLASPPQVDQIMYWYDVEADGYQLTLGEGEIVPRPAPTWREFFISQGIAYQTEKEVYEVWCDHGIGPEDYDSRSMRATGGVGFNGRIARLPKHIRFSARLISVRCLAPTGGHFWSFTKATITLWRNEAMAD